MPPNTSIKDKEPKKDLKDNSSNKSPLSLKTEKLSSAVYLVTNFLLNRDPIKWSLRQKSVDLMLLLSQMSYKTRSVEMEPAMSLISEIISLIDVAVFDRQASPMNFGILRREYGELQTTFASESVAFSDFTGPAVSIPSSLSSSQIGAPRVTPRQLNTPRHSRPPVRPRADRREVILAVLKPSIWLSIKEIANKLPDLSVKTVQRELTALTNDGSVKKVGERRWSRYSRG